MPRTNAFIFLAFLHCFVSVVFSLPADQKPELGTTNQNAACSCPQENQCEPTVQDQSPITMAANLLAAVSNRIYENKELVFALLAIAASSSAAVNESSFLSMGFD
mmetsp:Transcript_6181/g.12508  ORF Transcript_6181/g.12508 Transcript_6181/m.12508 type:complete len:105 (+) Transcript_6181:1-315(+)